MTLRLLAAIWAFFISTLSFAQTPGNKAYAITSQTNGSYDWTEVKQIDLSTGQVVRNIFERGSEYRLFDGRSSRQIMPQKETDSTIDKGNRPFSGLSAACAYDSKTNRLYYVPIYINQLRYIDLSASGKSVYLFEGEAFTTAKDLDLEKNQITRMVIASDGNGYAMSNDGSHLIRFTTGDRPVVSDLGAVSDAPANGEMSISDANTSWGGDLLSDANGRLYVITAHNHVFRIDVQTKVATYLSRIKKLPEGFTTNGAAVDADGKVVLSSANSLTAYFRVDPQSWEASIIPANGSVYNTSDLGSENLLFNTKPALSEAPVTIEGIAVYPNPVRANLFRVSFSNKKPGAYSIQLLDAAGRMVSAKTVNVSGSGQVSEIRVSPSLTRGVYMVQVSDLASGEVFMKKIVIE